MDIWPQHVPHIVNQGLLTALCETMQDSQSSPDYAQIVEDCIKIFGRVSLDNPRPLLKSGALMLCVNVMDFFDNNTQNQILSLIFNVSQSSDSEADFESNFLPVLPTLCQIISSKIFSDQDRQRQEKVSQILIRMTDSFTRILSPTEAFDQVGKMFDLFANTGMIQALVESLFNYSSCVEAQGKTNEQTNMIITSNLRSATDDTVANYFKVLRFSSVFSLKVYCQLILGGIFQILEPVLRSDQSNSIVVADALGLLNVLLPQNDEDREEIQISQKQKLLALQNDPKFQLFMKAARQIELQKHEYWVGQDESLHKKLSQSILPKIFAAYQNNMASEFRTLCLTCIKKILQAMPTKLLVECLDPSSFTTFIQIILKNHQPQQVLCALKMVQQLLESKIDLSIFFIRNGIKEAVAEYSNSDLIKKMNEFKPEKSRSSPSESAIQGFLSQLMTERDHLALRQKEIIAKMESLESGSKKEEIAIVAQKYQERLASIDQKVKQVQDDLVKEPVEVVSKVMYGNKISELAALIREKHLDNPQFWVDVSKAHAEMFNWMANLTQIAKEIIEDATQSQLSPNGTQNLMNRLCDVLTSEIGITSFEFEHSGILKAIKVFLNMPAAHARAFVSQEESKSSLDLVSQRDAKNFILRLRTFAQSMLTRHNGKIPFKQLLQACHQQLTLAEPLICQYNSNNQQGHMEALRQLCQTVTINLVYDAKSINEQNPVLQKAKSQPFVSLQSHPEKSLLYLKRHTLYEQLNQIPLQIQKCDNIWLIQEFLLKRIRNKQDVQKLAQHSQAGMFAENQPLPDSDIDKLSLKQQALYQRVLELIIRLLEECESEETFIERVPIFLKEVKETILAIDEKVPGVLFDLLKQETVSIIRDIHLEMGVGLSEEDMRVELGAREYTIVEQIQAKTQSFMLLIDKLKAEVNQSNAAEQITKCNAGHSLKRINQPANESYNGVYNCDVCKKGPLQCDAGYYHCTQGCNWDACIKCGKEEAVNQSDVVMEESDKKPKVPLGDSGEVSPGVGLSSESVEIAKTEEQQQKFKTKMMDPGSGPLTNGFHGDVARGHSFWVYPNHVQLCTPQWDTHGEAKMFCRAAVFVGQEGQLMQWKCQGHSQQLIQGAYHPVDLHQESQDEKTIDDLLKTSDDIEIVFSCNGKTIEPNTSMYEILKEKGGTSHQTIKFSIRDTTGLTKTRSDSLQENKTNRMRTKSLFVDEISVESANTVVKGLISDHFKVFGSDFVGGPETVQLEDALSVLKVLNWMYTNGSMLTNQGLKLFLKTSVEQIQEFDILTALKTELDQQMFHHAKLDGNLQKAIQDPYQLVSGGISQKLRQIFNSCPFLFPFETKQLFFKLVSFIGVDIYRSLYFLKKHIKRINQPQQSPNGLAEDKLLRISKQKVKVNREDKENLLQECLRVMREITKKTMLEVEYVGEEGTGLGPTLEFYTILSQMLRGDNTLWRKSVKDDCLFPKPIGPGQDVKLICQKFQMAGIFVAKSILDDRLIDLPISAVMWDLLLGKKQNLIDLKKIDKTFFELFSDLQVMANRKKEIDEMVLDPEMRSRLISQVKSSKGAHKIEDFGLCFYDPTNDEVELIKNGKNEPVTLNNLQHYIDLVLDSTFDTGICIQLRAFKQGFSSVLPIETLRIFDTETEIESLICGIPNNDSEWSSIAKLQECVVAAHGYNEKSKPFKEFLRYLAELEKELRPSFLRFVTGSPRLPIGGFASLEPHLTVVRKDVPEPDKTHPSVMTCHYYIKMPEYSSYEVLKSKFDYSIQHGVGAFTLS